MARAVLQEREPVGGGMWRHRLAVDEATAATHSRHGQYVEIRHDAPGSADAEATLGSATRALFVIASAPGERTWDVVVRDGSALGDRLKTLPLGAEIVVSTAQGEGFPVDDARGRPLVLATTGSGIAAVLSTVGARISSGDASRTYLLYGVRDRGDVALHPELEAMRSAGVDVAICLSREHVDEPGFYKGYVQNVAQERGWNLSGGLAFAAGNDAMIEGLRNAAPALGLSPGDVRVNA